MLLKPIRLLAGAVAALLVSSSAISAAGFPDRPLQLIVAYAPGGTLDVVARILATAVGAELGQPIVVKNTPGAVGLIALRELERSAPDGYTLLQADSGGLIPRLIDDDTGTVDPFASFAPVRRAAVWSTLLVVNSNSPYKSVQDILVAAKAKPGALKYPSGGVGSTPHVTALLFNREAKVDTKHIPYKGGAEQALSLLREETDFTFVGIGTVKQNLDANQLRALAITSASRSAMIPDIPTTGEAGLPGVISETWAGFVAPKGTPPEVIDILDKAMARALKRPEVVERFKAFDFSIVDEGPKAFKAAVDDYTSKWRDVARLAR